MHTKFSGHFTFSPPPFRWCPSFGSSIVFFPLGAPSSSSKFNLKVNRVLRGFSPCGPTFGLFKNHCFSIGFSSLPCSHALTEFQLEANLDFSLNMFMLAFIHSVHLSVGGPSCMVFEHLQILFDLKNLTNKFSQLFFICFYVDARCIFWEYNMGLWCCEVVNFGKAFW